MLYTECTIMPPEECEVLLADLIYDILKRGYGRCDYALSDLRYELEKCVEFLHKLPDDATPADIDILSGFTRSDEEEKEIMRLSRRPTEG